MTELAIAVGRHLDNAGLTIALAESCTGGLICSGITDVPGSSAYFLGGVVAYSDEAKEQLLGVDRATLERYGAVSEQTALEMARGIRCCLGADLGIAVTGIAGPGGGTPDKPVGLVYIALAAEAEERCEQHIWDSDRLGNKARSAEAAVGLVLRYLQERDGQAGRPVNQSRTLRSP